jgi:hypothetical protein
MPSTALIFLKRALPIAKPEALPFFEDGFLGAMPDASTDWTDSHEVPASVPGAWARWTCRNISGSPHETFFIGTGWEILWRTLACGFASLLIIPIPWVSRWYIRWYVSQFVLEKQSALADR